MTNLDYWQLFVGDHSPEEFMRTYGAMEPELCIARFLEDRGHFLGVVNQGSWEDTFQAPEQYHRVTVRVYLLSYLEETRAEWEPALEADPPATPRRYLEKYDPEKHTPQPVDEAVAGESETTPEGVPVEDDGTLRSEVDPTGDAGPNATTPAAPSETVIRDDENTAPVPGNGKVVAEAAPAPPAGDVADTTPPDDLADAGTDQSEEPR